MIPSRRQLTLLSSSNSSRSLKYGFMTSLLEISNYKTGVKLLREMNLQPVETKEFIQFNDLIKVNFKQLIYLSLL
jgi:hypothetical protein